MDPVSPLKGLQQFHRIKSSLIEECCDSVQVRTSAQGSQRYISEIDIIIALQAVLSTE